MALVLDRRRFENSQADHPALQQCFLNYRDFCCFSIEFSVVFQWSFQLFFSAFCFAVFFRCIAELRSQIGCEMSTRLAGLPLFHHGNNGFPPAADDLNEKPQSKSIEWRIETRKKPKQVSLERIEKIEKKTRGEWGSGSRREWLLFQLGNWEMLGRWRRPQEDRLGAFLMLAGPSLASTSLTRFQTDSADISPGLT